MITNETILNFIKGRNSTLKTLKYVLPPGKWKIIERIILDQRIKEAKKRKISLDKTKYIL